ncbi:hypothetical protein SUGI_0235180 [Cryptomeria japonica]|nr:hypothetical protein SUGI_0235180 [Cryptomeria japonica]
MAFNKISSGVDSVSLFSVFEPWKHPEPERQRANVVTLEEVLLMHDCARQQFWHGMNDYGKRILEWSHNPSGDG